MGAMVRLRVVDGMNVGGWLFGGCVGGVSLVVECEYRFTREGFL